MIRIVIILFLLTSSANADCKYTATADVKDNQLVNKVEKYVCKEDKSFLYQFWTEDEWARTATMTFLFLLENLQEKNMRILSIIIIGLLVTNCSNSYVKNKKTITSPDDLQKFVNVYCDKNKSTNKVIKVCGNGWSKDLNISENKAILSAKIKIADITQHSIVSNEIITHKENSKGITKTYDLTADSKLEEVSIAGYKIVHKKVLKEKNGWRTLVLIEYKIS